MHRRSFLAGVVAAALAGCAGRGGDETATRTDTATAAATETATETDTATPRAVSGDVRQVAGVDLPVPDEQLARGAGVDSIPAITDPEFGTDWSGVSVTVRSRMTGEEETREPRLRGDDQVVGVVRDGEARAYPLRVLNWHEVVNDTFGGPLLVTFCPLCGSGVTAVREVDGQETTFGVSGLLWNSDLVMYDEVTDSRWSQIAATAIQGPRTGHTLELVPSTITTLSDWRGSYPDTQVLRPPPESSTVVGSAAVRDYTRNPYASYDDVDQIGLGENEFDDDRLRPKTRVLGIASDGTARAYSLEAVRAAGGVVEDTVAGTPVVVATGADGTTLHGWRRTVDGRTLSFSATGDGRLAAGDSVWRAATGTAVSGPFEGTRLAPATDTGQLFWFAWAEFHPETTVYGRDG
ncbi:DUF3179 domain-containing protein [Halobaculum sp. MBLA0143]|uniref:DUF3179 domain-containing protein n=1 Tax=Halobaculum sp. MBLA0143 TaxID=3079933 RepID=UPI0035257D89